MAGQAALSRLPRDWWGIELPGYREAPADHATYSEFGSDLPPIERALDKELTWLMGEPAVPGSLAENDPTSKPTRPASEEALIDLLAGTHLDVPASFARFINERPPRARVRSCTACYLDLADAVVPAPGGSLIHFLSDQQWVLHWLLYIGADGSEAVVVSDTPYGFQAEAPTTFSVTSGSDEAEAVVCAESFNEFLYRFWVENEIWFALADRDGGPGDLNDEQRRYVEYYSR
jgi:hypothetical protein